MRAFMLFAVVAAFVLLDLAYGGVVQSVVSEQGGNIDIDKAAAAAALLDVEAGTDQSNEAPRQARQYFGGFYYNRPYGYVGGVYTRPYGSFYVRPYGYGGYGGYGSYGGFALYPGFGFYG